MSAYKADGDRSDFTTTDAQGGYSLFLPKGKSYRLEFTGIPDYLQPGAVGKDTKATVTFITAPVGDVNVGLNNPADYCQENPELGTPCYILGNQKPANREPALVSFNYRAGSTSLEAPFEPRGKSPYDDANNIPGNDFQKHPIEAYTEEIGPTYGLAYQRSANVIFAGAFMKRHSGFGPNGTGAIYRIDRAADTVTLYTNLNTIFGPNTAGKNPHPATGLLYFFHDPSFDEVGKISLGDVEISEDEKYLYTVNLKDKMLYRIPVLNEPPPADDIVRFPMPSPPGCVAVDIRPFALAIQDGTLYAGITCTAQSTQKKSDMRAYVYSFDGTSFGQQPVLDFPLEYPLGRGCADRNDNTGIDVVCTPKKGDKQGINKKADWNPWVGTFGDLLKKSGTAYVGDDQRRPIYPQPLLSDIEFANGYMIIGLRDRNGDLFGNGAGDPRDENGPVGFEGNLSDFTDTFLTVGAGDILAAAPDPDRPGRWKLENNASVGGGKPTGGKDNNNGPGGGEFFFDESYGVEVPGYKYPRHDEVAQGGLTYVPGKVDVLTTSLNPVPQDYIGNGKDENGNKNKRFINHYDGGIIWLSSEEGKEGTRSRSYRVFEGDEPEHEKLELPLDPLDEAILLQGKNNGLGDLELFCDMAPLEIGDRVWIDANRNGIQDPDEEPLAGVSVKLYAASDMTTPLATAVTNAEGNYYFSNAISGPLSRPYAVYDVKGLQPNTSGYKLRIDMTQPAIAGNNYELTLENADGHTDNNNKTDLRDSDAIIDDQNQNAEIMFDSGGAGHNNHTLDFGFIKDQVAVGNRVWLDDGAGGGTADDGIVNGTEVGIGGVKVQLYRGISVSGTPIKTTITGVDGCYLFDDLAPGDYIIHIPASQFTIGGPLLGLDSSSPQGDDTPDDDNVDENGQNTNTLVKDGISSTIINLAVGDEPTNEPSRNLCTSKQPDANENMTVDFGFVKDQSRVAVGNRVWLDDGAGGGTEADGIVNGTEMGIGSVEVQLYPITGVSGTPIKTTITRADGCYLFDDLVPSNYIIHIPASQFAAGSPLQGLSSSLPQGEDEPNDDNVDENGQNTKTPKDDGVSSTVIKLVVGDEPIEEVSRSLCQSTQLDPDENMTVDFGFSAPVPGIQIIKNTNGQDGPQIKPGDPVTWTYEITNSGSVSFAKEDIEVTDSRGEIPLFDLELAGNGDDILDPQEVWLYKAEGIAEEVGPPQGTVPTLWGVDEQKNDLFSVADYTKIPDEKAADLIIYGPLHYTNLNGVTQPIGKDIGSFTIDRNNVAYMTYNKNLDQGAGQPSLKAPVLMSFPLGNASTDPKTPNTVKVIGSIPIPGFDISPAVDDNISGLSFDPATGELFALYRVTDGPAPDKLLLISKDNASLIKDLGEIRNDALGAIVEDGEAIEFDESGNLYISDNWDDQLVQVDPQTNQIMRVIDDNQRGGLTGVGSQLKTEGLAWNPVTDTMVATDDRKDIFYIQTLENGSNVTLGALDGLLDVEAIDFLISCYMNVGEVKATVTVGGVTSSVSDTDPSYYCN